MKNTTITNVLLVYVERPDANVTQDLHELEELIKTANGKIVLTISQKRNTLDPTTVLGIGKIEEIKRSLEMVEEIEVAIFSCELDSQQRKFLQNELNIDIIDKIDLILDIFALRAQSAEGKKQVELAQLTYNLATKPNKNFSRQGAGIGTRGPGETKLETNKRLIRDRIHHLRQELKTIEQHRELSRKERKRNPVFTIALVGYTNAGKSTLFNLLTENQVYADNKLFATLDTTVRKTALPNGVNVLFCDTVGFIKDLPHQLINAFKSTLEEAVLADLVLNVCDISDENVENHIDVTEQLLGELGVTAPILRVYNKCDLMDSLPIVPTNRPTIFISAKTGKNIDVLLEEIASRTQTDYAKINLKIAIADYGKLVTLLNKYNAKFTVDFDEVDAFISATIRREYVDRFMDYIVI
ncbi:MAG: GTPase HflX [Clostridia bacterium]|nr:GTPase HflX [Clostridia bacterium]